MDEGSKHWPNIFSEFKSWYYDEEFNGFQE